MASARSLAGGPDFFSDRAQRCANEFSMWEVAKKTGKLRRGAVERRPEDACPCGIIWEIYGPVVETREREKGQFYQNRSWEMELLVQCVFF